MADPNMSLDSTILRALFEQALPSSFFSNASFIVSLAKAIGILAIIYIVFLIVKAIIQTRQAFRIKSIDLNVAAINHKLDQLLTKKKSK